MGAIFKAKDRETGAPYAINVLHPEFDQNEEIHSRFVKEARLIRNLKHPNLCQFHDAGITSGGTSYLAMEWIEGVNLQIKVTRDGPLSP